MPEFDVIRARQAVVSLIALILSIAVHEFAHAFVADRLGDRTPRLQGRVTLNPMAHADPIGTLLFPLAGIFFFGGMLFGWGKPVEVNPVSFTRKLRMKTAHMLVAAAGPISNVLFGLLVALVLFGLVRAGVPMKREVHLAVLMVIHLNFILAVFNLLPLPPLDGGTVLAGFLPDAPARRRAGTVTFAERAAQVMEFLERYGGWILLGLLLTNSRTGLLSLLLWPAKAMFALVVSALRLV